jgi:hypothetical protein
MCHLTWERLVSSDFNASCKVYSMDYEVRNTVKRSQIKDLGLMHSERAGASRVTGGSS